MSPLVSIIVVSYNTRTLLANCLASIVNEREGCMEVLVVDNHSTDGSPEMLAASFPTVTCLINPNNLGFAKANNRGIHQATGKYILLLNSDTIVRGHALPRMAEFMDAHPEAGAVTCRLLNADGTIQACVSHRPGPVMLFFRLFGLSGLMKSDRMRRFVRRWLSLFVGSTLRGYFAPYTADAPIEVDNISGACLMLRREAIEQVGLLDENFFMYFEDMDYCLRLCSTGWKLYYLPAGEIVHLVGQSSGGRMRDYSVDSFRSLFYFYSKHYPRRTQVAARAVVLCGSMFRWMVNFARSPSMDSTVYARNRAALTAIIRLCLTGASTPGAYQTVQP